MAKSLRYTTFRPGELEAQLRELCPDGLTVEMPVVSRNGGALFKTLTVAVTYPDGQSGECLYERGGPAYHLFRYTYADGSSLPRQTWSRRFDNDPASIEAKAKELADACYREARERERADFFQRASEPSDGSRKRDPSRAQMKAGKAKELAGKYALCARVGEALLPIGPMRETMEAANSDWLERGNPQLVVGCCSRLDRCWMLPRFNPLYAECDARLALGDKEGDNHA